jgi:Uma2 family endonuclease
MSLRRSEAVSTPDEYLVCERESPDRHEWLDGLIYAMAGESPEHSLICANVIAVLNTRLRGPRQRRPASDGETM